MLTPLIAWNANYDESLWGNFYMENISVNRCY